MPVVDRLSRLGKVRQISAIPPPEVVFGTVKRIFHVRPHAPEWDGSNNASFRLILATPLPMLSRA